MAHRYAVLFITIIALAGAGTLPQAVGAATNVVNTISVSATTGGNSASGGSVSEGRSESTVDITSYVNGVKVTDIHERRTDGEPIVIEHRVATGSVEHLETRESVRTTAEDVRMVSTAAVAAAAPETHEPVAPRNTPGEPRDETITNLISFTNPWNGTLDYDAPKGENTLASILFAHVVERAFHALYHVASLILF